jgi:hypothetical protein
LRFRGALGVEPTLEPPGGGVEGGALLAPPVPRAGIAGTATGAGANALATALWASNWPDWGLSFATGRGGGTGSRGRAAGDGGAGEGGGARALLGPGLGPPYSTCPAAAKARASSTSSASSQLKEKGTDVMLLYCN